MATATELTLTLGRTVYAGDPDSDERIQARETRVSVTWSLNEDEQDLTLTASVLAEEAEKALAQVGQPCLRAPCVNRNPNAVQQAHRPNGHADVAARSVPASVGSNGHSSRIATCGTAATSSPPQAPAVETATPRYGGYIPPQAGTNSGTGQAADGSDARTQTAPAPSSKMQSMAKADSVAKASAIKQSPITRAQCLAVHLHCTRCGIAQWELMRLVAEQFGKRNLEDLDKAQGGELLTMLQQAEHESRNPEYAN